MCIISGSFVHYTILSYVVSIRIMSCIPLYYVFWYCILYPGHTSAFDFMLCYLCIRAPVPMKLSLHCPTLVCFRCNPFECSYRPHIRVTCVYSHIRVIHISGSLVGIPISGSLVGIHPGHCYRFSSPGPFLSVTCDSFLSGSLSICITSILPSAHSFASFALQAPEPAFFF